MLTAAIVLLGLPGGGYLLCEFVPQYNAGWLWDLTPATHVFDVASVRKPFVAFGPIWALAIWPLVSVAVIGTAGWFRIIAAKSPA